MSQYMQPGFNALPMPDDPYTYGQRGARQWFDYSAAPWVPQPGGGDNANNQEQPFPWETFGDKNDPDAGRFGGNKTMREFDSLADYFNDPDVRANGRALAQILGVMSPTMTAIRGFTGNLPEQLDASARASINSMNTAGGALNPELAGRSDPSQGGMGGQTAGGTSSSGVEGDRGFMANGGLMRRQEALPPPRMTRGPGDGRSDSIPGGPGVRVSAGEMILPADVVSGAGRGDSEAGARRLGALAQAIRQKHMSRMAALPPPRA